jgi:hypothetical protein
MELVPKNTSGWSLITYLSYPPGNSVNDFIDEKLTTVQYYKFENVIYIIQTFHMILYFFITHNTTINNISVLLVEETGVP